MAKRRLTEEAAQKRADQLSEICERISNGETLRQICRDKHMISWQRVYQLLAEDADFAKRFARARDEGHDAIAEGALDIMDEPPERGPDGKIDPGYVSWQKNRIWTRLQLLAKWNPTKYGDKLDTTLHGPNGGPLEANIGLTIGFVGRDKQG